LGKTGRIRPCSVGLKPVGALKSSAGFTLGISVVILLVFVPLQD
jgi:hypothetical protein